MLQTIPFANKTQKQDINDNDAALDAIQAEFDDQYIGPAPQTTQDIDDETFDAQFIGQEPNYIHNLGLDLNDPLVQRAARIEGDINARQFRNPKPNPYVDASLPIHPSPSGGGDTFPPPGPSSAPPADILLASSAIAANEAITDVETEKLRETLRLAQERENEQKGAIEDMKRQMDKLTNDLITSEKMNAEQEKTWKTKIESERKIHNQRVEEEKRKFEEDLEATRNIQRIVPTETPLSQEQIVQLRAQFEKEKNEYKTGVEIEFERWKTISDNSLRAVKDELLEAKRQLEEGKKNYDIQVKYNEDLRTAVTRYADAVKVEAEQKQQLALDVVNKAEADKRRFIEITTTIAEKLPQIIDDILVLDWNKTKKRLDENMVENPAYFLVDRSQEYIRPYSEKSMVEEIMQDIKKKAIIDLNFAQWISEFPESQILTAINIPFKSLFAKKMHQHVEEFKNYYVLRIGQLENVAVKNIANEQMGSMRNKMNAMMRENEEKRIHQSQSENNEMLRRMVVNQINLSTIETLFEQNIQSVLGKISRNFLMKLPYTADRQKNMDALITWDGTRNGTGGIKKLFSWAFIKDKISTSLYESNRNIDGMSVDMIQQIIQPMHNNIKEMLEAIFHEQFMEIFNEVKQNQVQQQQEQLKRTAQVKIDEITQISQQQQVEIKNLKEDIYAEQTLAKAASEAYRQVASIIQKPQVTEGLVEKPISTDVPILLPKNIAKKKEKWEDWRPRNQQLLEEGVKSATQTLDERGRKRALEKSESQVRRESKSNKRSKSESPLRSVKITTSDKAVVFNPEGELVETDLPINKFDKEDVEELLRTVNKNIEDYVGRSDRPLKPTVVDMLKQTKQALQDQLHQFSAGVPVEDIEA